MKYRDVCQLSQEPLGDAEQVQDGALLEHGDVLHTKFFRENFHLWSVFMSCRAFHPLSFRAQSRNLSVMSSVLSSLSSRLSEAHGEISREVLVWRNIL